MTDEAMIIVPVVGIIAVVVIMGLAIRKSRKPLSVEIGKKAEYQVVCGARIDSINTTYPFIRVSLYDTFMVVSGLRSFVLYYSEIQDARISSGLMGLRKGVEIVHTNVNVPAQILLLSSVNNELLNSIKGKIRPEGR